MKKLTATAACLLVGCTAQQRAETAHASEVFACEVAVLAPYVPQVIDLEKLVEDVVTGKANLPTALVRLGATEAQVTSAVDSFNACFVGSPQLPAETAGS